MPIERSTIESIPLFRGAGQHEVAAVSGFASPCHFGTGQALMRQGEEAWEVLAILSGEVVVERNGTEIARRGPGEVIGEIGVVFDQPRYATVTSLEPLSLIMLTRWDVRRLREVGTEVLARLGILGASRLFGTQA